MRTLGRFVLVATATTGGLLWASLPFHAPYGRCYPLAGLLAAVLSAAIPRGPRIADYVVGRVLLSGCIALGLVSFIAIAGRNLVGTTAFQGGLWIVALVWLVSIGIVAKLVIEKCHAWTIYLGFLLAELSIACAAPHRENVIELAAGVALLGLAPALTAAITGALQRRFGAGDRADLPGARVVEP